MGISSFFSRLATASAVAAFAWAGSSATAADVYAAPMVVGESVAAGMPGCETCQHGAPRASCSTCKPPILFPNRYKPYQVNLCPGACFGYFQTQWRKWDEVCPYPYIGQGVGDAPRPAAPVVNIPRPGGELNPPRPVPMPGPKKPGEGLPPVPQVPGKFGP